MPQPDDRILELLTDLAGCLCSELTPDDADEPFMCLCNPIPGNFPAQSYAGEGEDMAWVRLVDFIATNTPGQQNQLTADRVFGRSLLVEMGVVRCFEWPERSEFGTDLLNDMFSRQMRDLGAMERALQCCVGRSWDQNQLVIGNYRPIGPEGNLYGGVRTLALQID